MENKSTNSYTPKIVGGVVIGAVVLIAAYILIINPLSAKKDSEQAHNTTQTSTTAASTSSSTNDQTSIGATQQQTQTPPATTGYKNGSYNATTTYRVPEGASNSIAIKVTITDGIVSTLDVNDNYEDRESSRYVSRFESQINSQVVGKKIDSVNLGRVGGASLTTEAFMEALNKVITSAKA